MKSVQRVKRPSRDILLKAKSLSGICIAALLYGIAAQAMSDAGELRGGDEQNVVYPTHTDTVSKQHRYDADGCLIGTTSVAGDERKEYDVLDRLVRHEGPEGVEEYSYFGISHKRRTIKRTPVGSGTPELTTFLYDGDNIIAEFSGEDLVLSKTYVTPELDRNLSMTIHTGPDAGTYYYSQDGLGSVRTVTDEAGATRNSHDYTGFGEPVNTLAELWQRFEFTGREPSALAGNIHYRNRNYDPLVGRFDGRDPAGYEYSVLGNVYAYASNRPTHYVDPYGLWNSTIHKELTENAMKATGHDLCTGTMATANVAVDGGGFAATWWLTYGQIFNSQADATPHYMATNPTIGAINRTRAKDAAEARIKNLVDKAHGFAENCDCENGATALGQALHTIQDKYSHANDRGMPISDLEHIKLGTKIDNEATNKTRHTAAQHETNSILLQYTNAWVAAGCEEKCPK